MTPEERDDDLAVAGEYVMGLLEPAEVEAVDRRLGVDSEFRALVARWSEDLAALMAEVAPVAPPTRVQAALRRRLFPEERQPLWRRLGLLPAVFGGLAAALLLLWTTNLGLLNPEPPGPAYAATMAAEDGSLVVAARLDPATGALTVDRSACAAPAGRSLELWLIVADTAPISLGVLPEGRTGTIEVPETLLASFPGALLALTDEPPGGSPDGIPTGSVLASGPITTL